MDDDFKGKALGAILLKSQMITPEQIEEALAEQKRSGVRLGEALVSLGIVSQEDVHWGLSQQKSYSFVRINNDLIDDAAIQAVPAEVARRHVLLPYLLIGDELTVVIDDPTNQAAVTELTEITGKKIIISIGLTDEIKAALDLCYGKDDGRSITLEPVGDFFSVEELEGLVGDHTGESFIRGLLSKACAAGVEQVLFNPGRAVELRIRTASRLKTAARMGQAWMHVLSRRLRKMTRGVATGQGTDGGVIDSADGGGSSWRVSWVDVVGGEAVIMERLSAPDIPVLSQAPEAWDAVREAGRGLVVVSGVDGPAGRRLLGLVEELLMDDGRMAVHLADSYAEGKKDVLRMRFESSTSRSRIEAIEAATALNPDVIMVEGLPDGELIDRMLRLAAGRRVVIAIVPLSSPRVAVEYLVETASSRTLLGEALVALVHMDVVAGNRAEKEGEAGVRDLAVLTPMGREVKGLIKSGALPTEVGDAVKAACAFAFQEALQGPLKRGEIDQEEFFRLTGSKDVGEA
ncbi:MAG: hypothetical protein GXP54_09085 [Deltaproteobacteria bacterium]|nr:hypothetical protein [Deltaproteobacteria bacterium]